MARYAHLHVHSHYSLLKALPKIPDLVSRAKQDGLESLALTDQDNLYGAIEFYKECTAAGIKPIIGLDAHMGDGRRMLLYAKNYEGYQNLLKIVTTSHFDFPNSPTVTKESLTKHKEGVLVIDPKSKEVALKEIYYLDPSDRRAWETMRAIENRGPVDEGDIDADEFYFHFPKTVEMEKEFSQVQLEKSLEIASQCDVKMELGKWIFPPYPLNKDTTYNGELRRIVEEGAKKKVKETPEIRERIEYEYKLITDKGYAPYFLIVADILRYAHEHKILTTIRGSVAGSLVTYLAGITNINPLDYQIPFERFLNPERPKAPDIDMDFADNRRDEVIEYVRKKYGEDHVAQIGTFGTMLARGVVRDVARALGYPYGLGDRIAKEVPIGSQGFPMTLDRALVENPELGKMYKAEREVREIIDLGKKIEGCARHISVHAAGVVISPEPLVNFTPLQLDPKGGKIITQYDMYSISDEYGGVGLLKFDFLGIRNLAILSHSIDLVEKTRSIQIQAEHIPIDDKKTFSMLAAGFTEGTFQLNGAGMTRFLKELRPSTIHDINAMVALFRPGPMETIPQYIERKHNPRLIHYIDPRMKEYLDFSYGVIVYQDDVLLTAIKLGGYTWLEADTLRKAMGKKVPAIMMAEKEKLVKGFIEKGKIAPALAEKIWKLIEPFAAYGFGKAHAASYGRVAYQTAYMKANYPLEYMASVLTAEAGDTDTVAIMIAECKRMGIPVLAPDVNESFGDFTVILPDSIRFGLYSIKNFGRGIADAIIEERKKNGAYISISDFLRRVKDQNLNKKGLESLIMCGALDSLGERAAMLSFIEQMLAYHRDSIAEHSHESLFESLGSDVSDIIVPRHDPALLMERLAWEKELLGLYVSGHPLDQFKEKLAKRSMTLAELKQKIPPGMTAVAAGMIEDIRTILTKTGDQMAFIKLADFDGSIEAVVFPKNFIVYKDILKLDSCVALKGRLSNRNGELSLVTEALKAL